jgi:hypothetical protein
MVVYSQEAVSVWGTGLSGGAPDSVRCARAGKKARARRAGSSSSRLGQARAGSRAAGEPSRASLASSTKSRAEPSQLAQAREPAREPSPTVNNVSAAQ